MTHSSGRAKKMLGAQFANRVVAHKWYAMNSDLLSSLLFTGKWNLAVIPIQRKKFYCVSQKGVHCYLCAARRKNARI